MVATPYQNKGFRVIQTLARRQFIKERDLSVGTMMSEPIMKSIAGPDATQPYEPGDDPSVDPNAILAMFADVRITARDEYIHDCLVPVQARSSIGQKGSPVTVWRDPSTGAYQIVGRANRVTDIQSVKTYSLFDLGLGFVKGQETDVLGRVVSPFEQYTANPKSVLSATINGNQQAGLHRGSAFVGGVPVTSYAAGTTLTTVPFGDIDFGTDPFGVLYKTTNNPDGTTTRIKVNP